MKSLKDFIIKHKKIFHLLGIIIFASVGMAFSYAYGYSNSDVRLYGNLMTLDYEFKNQKDLNFIHGYITRDLSISPKDAYTKNIDLQYKTIFKYKYYNSYLLSSSKGQITNFNIDLMSYENKAGLFSLDSTSVAMVRNFYDGDYMESIGLPLFTGEADQKANGIRPNKDGLAHGCYVSSSMAYDIATKMNLLNSNSDEDKIREAFNYIVDKNNNIFIKLNSNSTEMKVSINNIYLEDSFLFLFRDRQKKVNDRYYGNFHKTFEYWNKNTIITYAPELFELGSTFCFDIRGSYNNINLFVRDILGRQYAEDGTKIHFAIQNKELTKLSLGVDESCKNVTNGNIAFLIISIIAFYISTIIHIAYSLSRKNLSKKNIELLSLLSPFAVCFVFWVLVYLFLIVTKNYLFAYSYFNYVGNVVSLILIIAMVVDGFIGRYYCEKDEIIL